jgi:alkanesulfonate monooxygenase SsuD/methylene tetrahydromethanopterin reductase-like flavin-dependent oxidoreductase (luciferase family)
MASATGPRIAVALDGAGWHPAAWREPGARPRELLTAGYWTDLVREAEAAKLDFVTIEDSLALQTVSYLDRPGERTDIVQGRLDAVLVAARVAPLTSHIGLVPTAVVTHTEPFHLSKAIATLDYVSTGRAGVRLQVAGRAADNRHFGRREFGEFRLEDSAEPDKPSPLADLFDEAADYVEVLRRLWDSWEDDAEIRDVATGRFIDRDKLHYIDFTGRWFSVKGPSITPRPPQGQPVVTALAHAKPVYAFASRSVDLVFITPHDDDSLQEILDEVVGLKVYADLYVTFGGIIDPRSDALVLDGNATELVDLLLRWQQHGIEGVRLRPAVNATDLPVIVDEVVPLLQQAGRFRTAYTDGETLRERLGLPIAENRYASAEPS